MEVKAQIEALQQLSERDIQQLADVLRDCVAGGASVSFMAPLSESEAQDFWHKAAFAIERGEQMVLVARDSEGVIRGTISVILDQPANQPHRADIAKMLVHRNARNQGLGLALLQAAETQAQKAGKRTLVLDTANATAERLYAKNGWQVCGSIPNYALWPEGGYCATTVMYKLLA